MTEIISREEAKGRGLKYYFTGKACKHSHIVERFVSTAICTECNREKTRESYHKNPERFKESARRWARSNPDKRYRNFLSSRLRNTYGITVEQYDNMIRVQKGLCAICTDTCATGQRLSVDHNHQTNEIRGLLCRRCNTLVANLENNTKLLIKAHVYLQNPPASAVLNK
jgi:Autographiviridae endonuclease VII